MLRWLGRTAESFKLGPSFGSTAGMSVPESSVPGVLRVNTKALYDALNTQREARGMIWKQVGEEIGLNANRLTSLAKGGRTGFPHVLKMTEWLGRSLESFTHFLAG
jgi:hypothetical protein